MSEKLKTHKSYTFESLDFDELILVVKEFVDTELVGAESESHGNIYFGDTESEVTVEESAQIFLSKKYDKIYLSVTSRWGVNNELHLFISRNPNNISIIHNNLNPERGKKINEEIVKRLKLIDTYDARLLKIKSAAEKSYMHEALICKNSEAYRASIILGWSCVMNNLYSKIDKTYKADFISKLKERNIKNKKFKLKEIKLLEDYQQFKDIEVLEISEKIFLDIGTSRQLKYFLSVRNDCGHVRKWEPASSTVDAFFEEIFNNIYK